ncbi:MAG: hypothetical protein KJS83_00335 [Xanthomonadaceae bacterium]|nr:hypothetical protein [Xanthomonadaceae bacterium]MBU6477251.1 hypothetical protein [Xanthomonadaceae bacterium]MDE2054769.1 hypothetical protein [Xanthomonadaceae bacterium]MDE2225332.1 hypothetical protein [Xanthomonadaceae bacterium]MDE2496667.1 hypothetical protein [Xanthomonadaceae bacterium]
MFRHLFRYEHRSEPLLPWRLFLLRRVGKTAAAATAVIVVSLILGMLGYRLTEGMGWLNAFLNASMILGGMGPVDTLHSAPGKLFAGIYALYSGLVLVGTAGLLLAPFVHRLLHRFHLEGRREGQD